MVPPIGICAGLVCLDCGISERRLFPLTPGEELRELCTVESRSGPTLLHASSDVSCVGCGLFVPFVVEGLEYPGVMPCFDGLNWANPEDKDNSFYVPRVPGSTWDAPYWRRMVEELAEWGAVPRHPNPLQR